MKPVITLFISALFLSTLLMLLPPIDSGYLLLPSNWSNPANWSNVSGGPGGFSVPGLGDAVIFNNVRRRKLYPGYAGYSIEFYHQCRIYRHHFPGCKYRFNCQ